MASYLETRYLAPTNTKGARIRVIGAGSRITLATYDFDYAAANAHRAAVGQYVASGYGQSFETAFPTANGYVFRVIFPEWGK